MKHINTIIVGQGLAGSLLAWELLQHDQSILIVDNNHHHAASIAAAGIINPVTGQRFVLHPSTNQYLHNALLCYQTLAQFFKTTFYNPLPSVRVFNSEKEIQQFKKRKRDYRYNSFLGEAFPQPEISDLKQKLGGFYQTKTGYLDISLLLSRLKNYFIQQECYINDRLDYTHIRPTADSIQYKSYQADQLIFCEGYQLRNNPWFCSLPLIPTKGEILTIGLKNFNSTHIINNGKWLLPTVDGNFKFGATYEPDCTNTNISESNGILLLEKLASTIKSEITVKTHQAGLRPCTRDRAGLIGMHPNSARLGVFNGFGSKGAMTIPLFAQQFSQQLIGNAKQKQEEVNISRFKWNTEKDVFS